MRHSLFFYLLAVMTFLLTACSMQSPEADRSAVDASTESVSNNATQSGVSKEPDELPAKEDENKVENPEPSTETDVPVEEEPAQMPTLMLSIDGTPVTTYISSATKRGSSTFVCTPCDIPTRAIECGVQPKVLQKLLGHASIKATMDRYVHVTSESLDQAVRQFESGRVS